VKSSDRLGLGVPEFMSKIMPGYAREMRQLMQLNVHSNMT